jgi:hypothetical protein
MESIYENDFFGLLPEYFYYYFQLIEPDPFVERVDLQDMSGV